MKTWPERFWRILLASVVFIFAACGALHAAESSGPDYFLRSWKTDNGLPENSVTAVVQTHDGYLWLATYAGLARFDGVRFTIYSSANTPALQSDRLTSLFEDKQGNLWIGHERGDLTRYHDGKFESFNFHETGVRRKISAIGADEAGDIWMLNEEGTLTRVRDGASCALPNENGLAAMAQDGSGRLWVASGGKLAPLKDGKLVPLGETNDFVGYYVYGVCASRDGGLWIASEAECENGGTNSGSKTLAPIPALPSSRPCWKPGPGTWRWARLAAGCIF